MTSRAPTFALVISILGLSGVPCAAQVPATANTSAQIDAAFQEVLRNPGNLAIGQTYARLLVAAGNFEGGIAAMERLLLDPTVPPSVRLELGVLYYRVASYQMAEVHLRRALADPRLTGELRDVAGRLLEDVARRTASGSLFTGSLTIGLRGQSNPTAAANSERLLAAGVPYTRPANQGRKPSADVFFSAEALHELDFQSQDSATLVTTGSFFVNRYQNGADYDSTRIKTDPRDLAAGSFTTGVRFRPAPLDLPNLTLRPYLGGSELLLDGRQYMAAAGGGVDLNYRVENGGFVIGTTYDVRRTVFAKRSDTTESEKQSGYEQFLRLRMILEVTALQALTTDLTVRHRSTERDYFSFLGPELRVSYNFNFTNPFGGGDRVWGTSLYTVIGQRTYAGPDPSVKPGTTRADTEWAIGASQVIPLLDRVSAIFSVEYQDTHSNVANYAYRNVRAWGGLLWTF
ncbi:MAG: hypothetical protein EAZ99_12975 [Alphaproteobacteria bacterium]|nr:MAG: hypothetical protein EAZ99_12975 [Alphaproteobacteria bacterium]